MIVAVLFVLFNAFTLKEKDPLDKRVFLTNVIEVKEGQNSKKKHARRDRVQGWKDLQHRAQ